MINMGDNCDVSDMLHRSQPSRVMCLVWQKGQVIGVQFVQRGSCSGPADGSARLIDWPFLPMDFSIVSNGWDQVMSSIRQHKPAWLTTRTVLAAMALIAGSLTGCQARPDEQKSEEAKPDEQISLKPTTRSNFVNA